MTVSRNYIDGIETIEIGIRFHRLTIIRWSRWVEHAARLGVYCQEVSFLDVKLYYDTMVLQVT
jgi:hypothetical protein